MKTFEFLLLWLFIGTLAWAGSMTTNTGKGYYTFNGQVIGYYDLKNGTYPLSDGVSHTDTNGDNPSINQQALNSYLQ